MKRQNISQVVLPDGRIIAKTGTYSHVLVHNSYQPSTLFINVDLIKSVLMWSNSLAKLQDKLEFLVKCGWNRDELVIIETICGNNYNMKQEILAEMKRIEEHKQETIEEAANVFSNGFQLHLKIDNVRSLREGFVAGAKSDVARDYWFEKFKNEAEERQQPLKQENLEEAADDWFEQHKKK